MAILALCSTLVGAVIGIRMRVLVILPVIMFGMLMSGALAAFGGATASTAIWTAILCATCLQLGYLGGLFTRFCLAVSRLPSRRVLRSTTVRS